MFWLPFSLSNAFFHSLTDVFAKKSLKELDVYSVNLALRLFSLPLTFLALLYSIYSFGFPTITAGIIPALIISTIANTISAILYMKAIQASDISLCIPMITFTPMFLLLTSPIIVGEFPSALGIVGMIMIVSGSYVLNLDKMKDGITEPFKALWREKGPKYMLIVSMIWSISANIDKVGINNSSPMFWIFSIQFCITLAFIPLVLKKSKVRFKMMKKHANRLVPIGLFSGISLISQMIAVNATLVAYAISVKRTSAIMSVIWGRLIFKEKGTFLRVIGSSIMVLGVVVIALAS